MNRHQSPGNKCRDMSDYEKFRLKRMKQPNDDDNISAHFSNPLSTLTDRDEELRPTNNIFVKRCMETDRENQLVIKLTQKQKQCNQIYAKYGELMKKYQEAVKEVGYYKQKYEEKVNKDKQTKKKLQGWIKSAKTDLFEVN